MSTAEAKLQKLKVPDLKAILAKVSIPHSGLKKNELVEKILASPEALREAGIQSDAAPEPVVEAPAADLDAEYDDSPTNVAPSASIPAQAETSAAPVATPGSPPKAATSVPAAALPKPSKVNPQDDVDKRKARAARFGIPLVDEVKKAAPAKAAEPTKIAPAAAAASSAVAAAPANAPKLSESAVPLNDEEAEKRRKRAERFGLAKAAPVAAPAAAAVDPDEERKRKRAERFGFAPEAPAEKKVKA